MNEHILYKEQIQTLTNILKTSTSEITLNRIKYFKHKSSL